MYKKGGIETNKSSNLKIFKNLNWIKYLTLLETKCVPHNANDFHCITSL